MALEKIALEDEYFVSRKLYPNVDFYSGIVQRALGIPTSLFTCIFALARTVGWIAQWNEMISDPEQKIGRPRQLYTGPVQRDVRADREEEVRRREHGAVEWKVHMASVMKEFQGTHPTSTARTRRTSRSSTRHYLADPDSVRRLVARELRCLAEGQPRQEGRAPLGRDRRVRRPRAQPQAPAHVTRHRCKEVLKVLQYIRAHRVMGSLLRISIR